MTGHVFVALGDITQLSADAVAFSASNALGRDGNLYPPFEANGPGVARWSAGRPRRPGALPPVGTTFWLALGGERRPHGVVVVVATGKGLVEDKGGLAVRSALAEAVRRLREEGGRRDR